MFVHHGVIVDVRNPAWPNIDYTTITHRALVYEIMQDFYHQQEDRPEEASVLWRPLPVHVEPLCRFKGLVAWCWMQDPAELPCDLAEALMFCATSDSCALELLCKEAPSQCLMPCRARRSTQVSSGSNSERRMSRWEEFGDQCFHVQDGKQWLYDKRVKMHCHHPWAVPGISEDIQRLHKGFSELWRKSVNVRSRRVRSQKKSKRHLRRQPTYLFFISVCKSVATVWPHVYL